MHISELVSQIANNNKLSLGKYKLICLISGLGGGWGGGGHTQLNSNQNLSVKLNLFFFLNKNPFAEGTSQPDIRTGPVQEKIN